MINTDIIGFAGWSGSGKTTFIEKLIPELNNRGISCAVIKHDVHGLSKDDFGKDSRRFLDAGAMHCILIGPDEGYDEALEDAVNSIKDVRLIIVEGFKNSNITQIGVCRAANGKGFTAPLSRFIALVTDVPVETDKPCFSYDSIKEFADFIKLRIKS